MGNSKLDVYLWGMKVGTLTEEVKGGSIFYFEREFLSKGLDIAPFAASIHSTRIQNGLPVFGNKEKLFGGLPSFLADSLPDSWGNKVFDEWAKRNRIRNKSLSPVDRLAYMECRCMGAFEFHPPTNVELEKPFRVEVSSLFDLAQETLENAAHIHETLDENLMYESLFRIGTSAGGKRPKAIVSINFDTKEIISGQVSCPPGFTPYILKFDEKKSYPTTTVEYSYYLMAQYAGIDMRPSLLLNDNGATHFLTERFDRNGTEKIHVQTLAALRPESDSYEDLFRTAFDLGVSRQEMSELFRRMAFNVYSGNVDDHNKNFSFQMSRNGKWSITPAYDLTFTVDLSQPWYINRRCMSVNGKSDEISDKDMLGIATRYDVLGAPGILQQVKHTLSDYEHYAREAGVEPLWADKIQAEIGKRIEVGLSESRERGRGR